MKKVFNANETADLNGWHKNTDLAVNLKTVLHSDTSMRTGKDYQGVLRRDWDAEIEANVKPKFVELNKKAFHAGYSL